MPDTPRPADEPTEANPRPATTAPTTDDARLASITVLHKGAHDSPDGGKACCLLEAVAYIAGEPHTDQPACTSPVLGVFGRSLNDLLPDGLRQNLIPLIPRMVGTAGDGQDEARSYMALDWLIRVYTPTWLDLAGCTAAAAELRALGRIVDMVSAERAGPVVRAGAQEAQGKRAAAWAAAGDAAWAAAWAAAGDAAGAAARDAARDAAGAAARDAAGAAARDAAWAAARDAAGDAAWAAAGDAAGAAAWAAARAAARDAAGDAAWAAARDAAGAAARDAAGAAAWAAAGDAAGAAARDALAPTVDSLQRSAITLLDAMIDPSAGVSQ